MDGLIPVDKPTSWTSHDVVAELRRILGQKKIGHFGTLDPMASGLLLAAAGKATRLFPLFSKLDKAYDARIRFGTATDTYDAEGRPTGAEAGEAPDRDALTAALREFEGEITQWPPPFSAKKVRGKPMYAYARRRTEVEGRPFRVRIHALRLRDYTPPDADVEIQCSSGTYIRTLAHDLGRRLGCGAHLVGLVRTGIGDYALGQGLSLDEIRRLRESGRTADYLLPLESLLPTLPKIVLNDLGLEFIKNGRPISAEHASHPLPRALQESVGSACPIRLFSPAGSLVALARPAASPGRYAPFLVFL